jgi:dihydroneopterin aldolase/D-erythro-7,8-dihydroneopterin triphosphate epimerase
MPDCIEIHDLLLRTIIGINPDERVNRQDVIINVRLETDVRAAAKSDRIEDAVNYRDISKDVIDLVEGSKFQLVERLADAIARLCLRDPRVTRVVVKVEKPSALRFARSVGVTIERGRGDVDR